MITFKNFLQESTYKSDISAEEAKKLFDEHCSDMDFSKPLWRGFRNDEVVAMLVQGELGGRKSANTTNHYTVVLDEFLPKLGYPKRSSSIICGNNLNRTYTRGFGSVYAIFPYNDVPIGLVKNFDIWGLDIHFKNLKVPKTMDQFNYILKRFGVSDRSFKDLVSDIGNIGKDDEYNKELFQQYSLGSSEAEIKKSLKNMFTPPNLKIELVTTKTIDSYRGKAECWIGGKCLAIKRDVWLKMAKDSK